MALEQLSRLIALFREARFSPAELLGGAWLAEAYSPEGRSPAKRVHSGKGLAQEDRIFRIAYAAARVVVKKAGRRVGVDLSPHDLRRHAATHASRSGTPIEIVSKVILRHANLSTTVPRSAILGR